MSPAIRTNLALLVLRVGIGLIAMYYGSQKLLGMFGGPGFHGTVVFMQDKYGIPPALAALAMAAEFLGGLGLIFGALTSLAAFGLACTMAVAAYETWKDPTFVHALFTKAPPQAAAQAFFPPSLFVAAFALMLIGAGDWSLDRKLFAGKTKKKAQ